jgi:hypothetical protein
MPLSRRRLLPLPLLLLIPAALGGCKSAGIKDAFTSRDAAGRLKTRAFEPDETEIHLIVEFVSGREDAVLEIELFVPEGSVAKFDQLEIAPGKGDHRIDIKLVIEDDQGQQDDDGPWSSGAYEADLLIDGEYQETVKFDVL